MYDRRQEDRELNFEPSGALESASLVLRDRETDSWWSLMGSRAIGGSLEGVRLEELDHGEKTTWGEWRERHPSSLVLSVDGVEHVENNPYDEYVTDEGTFRGLEVDDDRLAPKEPIYSFWLDDEPWAVTHESIEGGWATTEAGRTLVFDREPGASIFRSSEAWLLPDGLDAAEPDGLLRRLRAGEIEGAEGLGGFDTYWYTWVGVNPSTRLLRR